ncbi:MAG: hypothetical protein AAF549_02215 [Pseudomonadota bacterium]
MRVFILLSSVFLTACGSAGLNLMPYYDDTATPQSFPLCHGYSCTSKTQTAFTKKEWLQIKAILKKSKTAEQEREQIGKAIAKAEQIIGPKTNTDQDLAMAPIIRRSHQELDCIDETVNTTKYLNFFFGEGLLKFHTVGQPAYRGALINGNYPHNTATIIDNETKEVFVVDSYVYAAGEAPDIRTVQSWKRYKLDELKNAN